MSDQEEWGDDDQIDVGDHLAVADEPPVIEYSCVEGADGGAKVPIINTHPPDPTHPSMPNSSPVADVDMGTTDPDCDIDTKEAEIDVVVEEEYYKQEEELNYEDNEPAEEPPINVDEHKAKCPGV